MKTGATEREEKDYRKEGSKAATFSEPHMLPAEKMFAAVESNITVVRDETDNSRACGGARLEAAVSRTSSCTAIDEVASVSSVSRGLSLTAPSSPGLSYDDCSTSPSARSQGQRSTAAMSTGTCDDDHDESALSDKNDRLCLGAAVCFVRLFSTSDVAESSQRRSSLTGAQHRVHSLVFTPLRTLVHGGFCSRGTLAFALVIAKRLASSGFLISWANCRRVLLCVIMLAGKVHADEYYTFSTLAACVGMPVTSNTMSSLAQCEWKICVALDFCLQCSPDDYASVVRDALPPDYEDN